MNLYISPGIGVLLVMFFLLALAGLTCQGVDYIITAVIIIIAAASLYGGITGSKNPSLPKRLATKH